MIRVCSFVYYIIFIYVWGGREGGVHELAHFPTILIYTRETDGEENYLRLPIPTVQNPPQFELHV